MKALVKDRLLMIIKHYFQYDYYLFIIVDLQQVNNTFLNVIHVV
jgi:hypothetical protein